MQNCEQARRVCTFLTPKAVQDVCSASILPCKCHVLLGFAHRACKSRAKIHGSLCKSRASMRMCTEQNLHNSFARYWPNRANVMESASKACTGLARALHMFARLFARRRPAAVASLFAFVRRPPARTYTSGGGSTAMHCVSLDRQPHHIQGRVAACSYIAAYVLVSTSRLG